MCWLSWPSAANRAILGGVRVAQASVGRELTASLAGVRALLAAGTGRRAWSGAPPGEEYTRTV